MGPKVLARIMNREVLHKCMQCKRRGTCWIRRGTRAQEDVLRCVQKSGEKWLPCDIYQEIHPGSFKPTVLTQECTIKVLTEPIKYALECSSLSIIRSLSLSFVFHSFFIVL